MRWHWKVLIGFCVVAATVVALISWRNANPVSLPITDLKSHVLFMQADRIRTLPPQFWVVLPEASSKLAVKVEQKTTPPAKPVPNSHGYLGAEACAECHRERFDSFKETAHFKTSRQPTLENVFGSFEPGKNVLKTSRSNLQFTMESKPDGLHQRVDITDNGKKYAHTERFDVITGSGSHGQSYLYWKAGGLYQLPVSFFASLDGWVNSPGYTEGTANFSRAIRPRCLECHTTYFEYQPGTMNEYRHDNYILGLSCERCHGPGAKHVEFHRAHPGEKHGSHIVHPGHLPVERRHDVCRQCHSRSGASLQPPFSYRPGEVLARYLDMAVDDEVAPGAAGIHTANQFARLKMSKCFQKSPQMSCIDCHNPHRNEHGKLELFSQRCQKCHQPDKCGMHKTLGKKIERNCIDCHMASRLDALIAVKTATATVSNSMRDHAITVDRPLAEKLIKQGLFD